MIGKFLVLAVTTIRIQLITGLRVLPPLGLSKSSGRMISGGGLQQLVLGSGSKTRREILTEMGFEITIVKPDVDESAIGDRTQGAAKAEELVLLLAHAKADAARQKLVSENNDKLLVTADQVVTNKGRILEKPQSANEVYSYINDYGMYPCHTVGSIVITDLKTGIRVEVGYAI